MKAHSLRLAIFTVIVLAAGAADANICMDKWREGRAIHAALQRKAIEELDRKDYTAACKTMQELADLSESMRRFSQLNCRSSQDLKRMFARTDDIAARADEICAKARQ